MPKRPCLICGEPTAGSRCEQHEQTGRVRLKRQVATRTDTSKTAWKNLSQRARRAQPFCLLCGSREALQADHSPRAWARLAAGRSVRLADITVLCQRCNLAAGSSKPGTDRYAAWKAADGGDLAARTPDPTLPRPARPPRRATQGRRGAQPVSPFARPSRKHRYSPQGGGF